MRLIGGEGGVAIVNKNLTNIHHFIPGSGLFRDTAGIKDILVEPDMRRIGEVHVGAIALSLGQDIICTDDAVAVSSAVRLGVNSFVVLTQISHLILPQNHAGIGIGLKHRDLGAGFQCGAQGRLDVGALEGDFNGNTGVLLHERIRCSGDDLTVVGGLRVGRPVNDVGLQRALLFGSTDFGSFRFRSFGSFRIFAGSLCIIAAAGKHANAQHQNQQKANDSLHFVSS